MSEGAGGLVWRPGSYAYTRPDPTPLLPPASPMPSAGPKIQLPASKAVIRDTNQMSFLSLAVVSLTIMFITFGAVAGYVRFFQPDHDYVKRFAALAAEDAAIQALLDTETSIRTAADSNIVGLQTALDTDIDQEVATRTAQDMYLMQLLATEIAQRQAAQALLNSQLSNEIFIRSSTDNATDYQLDDLERRLKILQDYDVYALQQFMIKMDNLTHIQERLDAEIAERLASDSALSTQDMIQQSQINTISIDLANEIATRTAADMAAMAQIAPFLTGLFSINNQNGVANNFNLVSNSPCGITVGNGGGNIITLSSNFMLTLGGMAPNPTTRNIGIFAGNNILITPNPGTSQLRVDMIAIPVPANENNFAGVLVTTAAVAPGNNWNFDLAYAGSVITNFPTYNGFGWEIPVDMIAGVPLGTFIVRMKLHLTLQIQIMPEAIPITYGTCIGTHAQCVAFPSANTPSKTYSWSSSYGAFQSYLQTWGLEFHDMTTEITVIVNGAGYPATTGVYPVWRYTGTFGSLGAPLVTLVAVEYHITRIH